MSMRKTQRTVHFAKPLFRLLERYVNAVNDERNPRPPLGYGKIIETLVEKGLEHVKLEKALEGPSCLVLNGEKAVDVHIRQKYATPALLEFIRDNGLEEALFSYLKEESVPGGNKGLAATSILKLVKNYDHAPGFACLSEEERDGSSKKKAEASP